MTMAKQDLASWQRRIEKTLKELTTRMDAVDIRNVEQTQILHRIEELLNRVSLIKKIMCWLARAGQKSIVWTGQAGLAVLVLATVVFVASNSYTLREAFVSFIRIFNGTVV